MRKISFMLVMAVFCFAGSPALAVKGFRLGAGVGFSLPTFTSGYADTVEPRSGIALSLFDAGYGFTDAASINLRLSLAGGPADAEDLESRVEEETGVPADADFVWSFAEWGLDFRYAFLTDEPFNPFLLVGLGASGISLTGEVNNADYKFDADSSVGVDLGGGFQYYLGEKQRFSLGGMLLWHLVEYGGGTLDREDMPDIDYDSNIEKGVVMTLFTLNYTWRQ